MDKNQKKSSKHKMLAGVILAVILFSLAQVPVRKFAAQKISDRADHYFNGGEYNLEKAEKLYEKVLAIDQKNWKAHYQLARIDLVKSEFDNGVAEINKALAADPQKKRAYYVRGLLDGYAKDYTEAEKDFQNFIAWAPNEWAGYVDLSWVYINSQKYDEAVTTTNNALVLFPKNTWLYSNKGLAEYKLGKYDEAKTDLGIARKLAKKLTPEEWSKAYPGNNSADAEKGVVEIRKAIDYNLKLAYEKSGDDQGIDELNLASSDTKFLSKYAGKKDISDGVTLSACLSAHIDTPVNGDAFNYGSSIGFSGHGEGTDNQGQPVNRYEWQSVSGIFCDQYNCSNSTFSQGNNTVYFKVGTDWCSPFGCSHGRYSEWSDWVTVNFNVISQVISQVTHLNVNIDQGDCNTGVGYGKVTFNPVGGFDWCTNNCTQDYFLNTWVGMYAGVEGSGCEFDRWEGPACSDPNCGLSMVGDFTITAHYKKSSSLKFNTIVDTYSCPSGHKFGRIQDNSSIDCNSSCSYDYNLHDTISNLTALSVDSECAFSYWYWYHNGVSDPINPYPTIDMDQDYTVTAVYKDNAFCTPDPNTCGGLAKAATVCKGQRYPDEKCGAYICMGTKDCTGWMEVGN
jgi:tetratricopeptide (TPR) repeat protein